MVPLATVHALIVIRPKNPVAVMSLGQSLSTMECQDIFGQQEVSLTVRDPVEGFRFLGTYGIGCVVSVSNFGVWTFKDPKSVVEGMLIVWLRLLGSNWVACLCVLALRVLSEAKAAQPWSTSICIHIYAHTYTCISVYVRLAISAMSASFFGNAFFDIES